MKCDNENFMSSSHISEIFKILLPLRFVKIIETNLGRCFRVMKILGSLLPMVGGKAYYVPLLKNIVKVSLLVKIELYQHYDPRSSRINIS